MNKKILLIFCSTIALSACVSQLYKKPPNNHPSDDASIKLAEAASAVSESMQQMARVQKVISPPNKDNTLTIPSASNLQARASVDWSGPIAELIARISASAHFRLRILGTPPAVPVLISLNINDQSLAEILRNIDYQAGKKAYIHVYPNTQTIELRYAKIYS